MEQTKEHIHDCKQDENYLHTRKRLYSDEFDFSKQMALHKDYDTDFYDNIMNAEIYFRGKKIELNSFQDLSLYYAFIVDCFYDKHNGHYIIKLGDLDWNTHLLNNIYRDKRFWTKSFEEYQKNWVAAIVENGFDEEFARKWVYEQAYLEIKNPQLYKKSNPTCKED